MKKKTIKKVMRLIVESGAMYDVTTCEFDKAAKKINKFLKHIEQQQEDEEQETERTEQKQPSFEWKDCFTGKGYWSNDDATIVFVKNSANNYCHINVASNGRIIEKFHAECQLSHIIPKINEYVKDVLKEKENIRYISLFGAEKEICTYQSYKGHLSPLYNNTAFKILLQTNEPLLKQYFGL